jgi:AAHS family 3-hydroxyphenylpropionic acid transporter
MPLGGSIASGVAAGLDWRSIFEVGGIVPLAIAALMTLTLPESPRFLATRGVSGSRSARSNLLQVFFGGGRALPTLVLWTAAFSVLLILFLLLNWLPTLMAAKGVTKPQAALVQLLFNIGGCLAGLAIAALFSGSRRAGAFALWFGGMTVSVMLLAFAPATLAALGAAGFAAGFFISSAPIALYALAPDFYAVQMRGTGLGGVIGVGRIGAILGPLLAGALLVGGWDTRGVLLALPPFVAVATVATFVALSRRSAPGL